MLPRRMRNQSVARREQALGAARYLILAFLFLSPCCGILLAEDSVAPGPVSTIPSGTAPIILTPQEQAWLRQHPIIRVGLDPSWPPFSYYTRDHELVGMDVDFLKILQQRLGVTFVAISGQNWSGVYAKAKNGEVDMLAGVAQTPERTALLDFTDSYVEFPAAIITRADAPFIVGLANLEGHPVAAARDYATTLLLQRDYPKVKLVMTENVADALRLVSKGEAFAVLDNLASANYLIKDIGVRNLKVAGITNYEFALRYGVRKDWPELTGILRQALASIPDHERAEVKDKWISLNVENLIASNQHQKLLLICLGVISVLVLLIVLWNRTLAREVKRRVEKEISMRAAHNQAIDANRMKSAFLANLSHEIRNPLNALLGFTELLKQETTEKKFQKYVDAIDAGGRTLLGVINDVLDLSKVEAGRLEIHPAPVNLRVVAGETQALFAQRAAQKGLDFTAEVAAATPPFLLLDELRLRQILYNSVSNAIKFTESGSVRLSVLFAPMENVLTLEVIDTGAGIPAEDHQRIFEPFAQREGQSPLLGGTGLGLAISKRLTELMGGRVELESLPGRGTTFRFVFSQVQQVGLEAQKPNSNRGNLADFKPLKVLVVDDLESNRELVREYFQRADHIVWDAENAEDGIILVQTQRPDIVLFDFRLPGMNGREAVRRLKADPDTAPIPVIFLSGSIQGALEVSDFHDTIVLAKPLVYAELVEALRRLLPHAVKAG